MTWYVAALLAPLLWATSNLIDESLVHDSRAGAWTLALTSGLFSTIPCAIAAVHGGVAWPGARILLIAGGSGVLAVLTYLPYLVALASAPASRAALLWNLGPVMVIGGARIWLGEHLDLLQYAGVALLCVSSLIGAGAIHGDNGPRRASTSACMLIACLCFSGETVLEKLLYAHVSIWVGLFWKCLIMASFSAAALALSPGRRVRINAIVSTGPITFLNGLLDIGGSTATSAALAIGAASAVRAVGALQPLMVLVLGLLFRRGRSTWRSDATAVIAAAPFAVLGYWLLRVWE